MCLGSQCEISIPSKVGVAIVLAVYKNSEKIAAKYFLPFDIALPNPSDLNISISNFTVKSLSALAQCQGASPSLDRLSGLGTGWLARAVSHSRHIGSVSQHSPIGADRDQDGI